MSISIVLLYLKKYYCTYDTVNGLTDWKERGTERASATDFAFRAISGTIRVENTKFCCACVRGAAARLV
jgi:hypothetical protein